MQRDFHYEAAYCAAILAGYSHADSMVIAYSDQFTDCCSRTFLSKIHGPAHAATTQTQIELADARTDVLARQEMTRIWASFHFLPADLQAEVKGCREYQWKYRLICGPNSELAMETVRRARNSSLQAAGIAMHVLCDTWAHRYFAGTPSLVINNVTGACAEILPEGERRVEFRHSVSTPDDPEKSQYTSSMFQYGEHSIMNLGHGRMGHLPDYSYIRYRYMPAWGDYREVIKDNPAEYMQAFTQMVEALKYLRGVVSSFEPEQTDVERTAPYREEIRRILEKRQLSAEADWRALAGKLSGHVLEPFDPVKYQEEYVETVRTERGETFLGRYFEAAMDQKNFVSSRILESGNLLAGFAMKRRRSHE